MIPLGDAGIRQTLREMSSIARTWKRDPLVRELGLSIIEPCDSRDWICEVAAIHSWVQGNIRFRGDVAGVETLQTPDVTLRLGVGDCDDHSILVASLLLATGHPARFIAVDLGRGYEHVLTETLIGREWIAAETTEPWELGQRPEPMARPPMIEHL